MARPVMNTQSVLHRFERYMKTVSVAGLRGEWLVFASGYLIRATSGATRLLGLLEADWTNDANNTPVNVEVDEKAIYEMDVTGTLVQATHVGNDYDLTDQNTLNLGATSNKVLTVVGITPAGRALCKLAKPY